MAAPGGILWISPLGRPHKRVTVWLIELTTPLRVTFRAIARPIMATLCCYVQVKFKTTKISFARPLLRALRLPEGAFRRQTAFPIEGCRWGGCRHVVNKTTGPLMREKVYKSNDVQKFHSNGHLYSHFDEELCSHTRGRNPNNPRCFH